MSQLLLFSCEHGGRDVPARYRQTLAGAEAALDTHRGWDPGALVLARELARAFRAPLEACEVTRLLIDPNRSLGHEGLFSEWSRRLPSAERERVIETYWRPHQERVEGRVRAAVEAGDDVLHLSIHSFAPVWKGRERAVDVGWLHDPARAAERAFCEAWRDPLRARTEGLRLRRNRPYFGNTDGLTTRLRARFPAARYLGIELEINQRFPRGDAGTWEQLRHALAAALAEALAAQARP